MHRLTFNFKEEPAEQGTRPAANFLVDLTDSEFESLFKMREIAIEKKLQTVELFIPRAKHTPANEQQIHADLVIDVSSGVALKHPPVGASGKDRYSAWVDWGTLDLIFVWGDSLDKPLPSDEDSATEAEVCNSTEGVTL